MSQKPAVDRYDLITQIFHWIVAALLIAMLVTNWLRGAAPEDTPQELYWLKLHISLGITLFIVVVLRIGWSRLVGRPGPAPGMLVTRILAKIVHVLLNLGTLLVPIFGYLRVVSKGRTVEFFGTSLPSIIGETPKLNEWMHILHGQPMEYYFYVLITLHVLAALWHQYLMKDRTMDRMLPWARA